MRRTAILILSMLIPGSSLFDGLSVALAQNNEAYSPTAPAVARDRLRTEMIRIRTDDGFTLHGAVWAPANGKPKVGVALGAGTGSEFYEDWLVWLGEHLAEKGYLVVSLNRRDHGAYFGDYEIAPSAMDHRYAVDFLAARGVEKVILGGKSYATVTVPYYVNETDDRRVFAIILYSALGDLRSGAVKPLGQKKYEEIVAKASQMVAAGKGNERFLMPGVSGTMHTYAVFLDKRGPNSKAVPFRLMKAIKNRPILAFRDPADPSPATLPPAQQQLEESNKNLQYVLLPDIRSGKMDPAAHHFVGREEEVFRITVDWLKKNGLAP